MAFLEGLQSLFVEYGLGRQVCEGCPDFAALMDSDCLLPQIQFHVAQALHRSLNGMLAYDSRNAECGFIEGKPQVVRPRVIAFLGQK